MITLARDDYGLLADKEIPGYVSPLSWDGMYTWWFTVQIQPNGRRYIPWLEAHPDQDYLGFCLLRIGNMIDRCGLMKHRSTIIGGPLDLQEAIRRVAAIYVSAASTYGYDIMPDRLSDFLISRIKAAIDVGDSLYAINDAETTTEESIVELMQMAREIWIVERERRELARKETLVS